MRRALLAAALSLLACACSDAARYRSPPAPPPHDEVSAPRVTHAAAPGAPAPAPAHSSEVPPPPPLANLPAHAGIGALTGHDSLKRFFEALARLEEGRAHEDVRVVHFGDSHTAADFETGPLRRALQGRFGDGGRGFVALGSALPHWAQEGVRLGASREFVTERGRWVKGKHVGDGLYGLGGASASASHAGARAWMELGTKAPKVELAYLEQPRGGSFDLYVDGSRKGRVSTAAGATASAWKVLELSDAPHKLEARAAGDGDVRLFGATVDRPEVGITLDALGINGARASMALSWSEPHMVEQLRHRAPELVVLAYGTAEAADDTGAATYERQLVDLLGRIARAVPTASCLLLGPPDRAARAHERWSTMPRLVEVVEIQRRVAAAAGCGFYDQLAAMGGEGSISAWAAEPTPRAGKDHVHLTRDGYATLANAFATDLLRAYASWRAATGLPPSNVTPSTLASPSPLQPIAVPGRTSAHVRPSR